MNKALRNFVEAAATAGAIVLVINCFGWLLQWKYHISLTAELRLMLGTLKLVVLIAPMVLLGMKIASERFPAGPKYRTWLLTTPWRAGVPLPLGPVYANVADAMLIAGFALVAWLDRTWSPAAPLMAFAAGYVPIAAIALARLGPRPVAALLAVGAGEIVRLLPDARWIFVMLMAMYVLAAWGLARSLRRFPWGKDQQKMPTPSLGAVFERLGPESKNMEIPWSKMLTISAIAAWWLYCICSRLDDSAPDLAHYFAMAVGAFACWAALFRWATYFGRGLPPISLWGRIRTGRLIVPGYDYVFLAPLGVALCGVIVPTALINIGAPSAVAYAAALGLTILAVFKLPPSLRCWQLTGHHRIPLNAANRKTEVLAG